MSNTVTITSETLGAEQLRKIGAYWRGAAPSVFLRSHMSGPLRKALTNEFDESKK